MNNLKIVPCVIMRGGTSKGVFISSLDIPSSKEQREKIICSLFGSPDPRQIDGLGGADPLTSKVAIVGPSNRSDADVDYTFGAVSINEAHVDFLGNCGNLTSAVGPFALERGFIKPTEPVTEVKIHNTNTGKLIKAYIPVKNNEVQYTGDYMIYGVPGSGARIDIDFASTQGAVTGKLLPTGNVTDHLTISQAISIEGSIIDIANPVVFIRAKDLGLSGQETPKDVDSNQYLLDKLELIRGAAATKIGLCKNAAAAVTETPHIPMIAMVSKPRSKKATITSRLMYMQLMHKTYSATASICTAAAIKIHGTIPNLLAGHHNNEELILIKHPAGIIDVKIIIEHVEDSWHVKKALVGRTARKIMEGSAYYKI